MSSTCRTCVVVFDSLRPLSLLRPVLPRLLLSSVLMFPDLQTDLYDPDSVENDVRHSAKGASTPTTSPTPSHTVSTLLKQTNLQDGHWFGLELLCWHSGKFARVARSSNSAELQAAADAEGELSYIRLP